ncbi:MAG: amidohydrolase family protein, partial [Bacteroidota bacterium]
FFIGFCHLNPTLGAEHVDEETRHCFGETHAGFGFRGIKLEIANNAADPCMDAVMDAARRYGVPVLQHAADQTHLGERAYHTDPEDVATLARRHPDVPIIMAHMTSVAFRGLRAVRDCPNVVVDTSAYQPEAGLLRYAVDLLGPGRVLYGSDFPIRDWPVALGRIAAAGLSDAERQMVGHSNATHLLNLAPVPSKLPQPTNPPTHQPTDLNCWLGSWPFRLAASATVEQLTETLRKAGVARGYVSALDAVLAPDPGPANQAVRAAVSGVELLSFVPVANPRLHGWLDDLEETGTPYVRLVPNYHGYRLRDTVGIDAVDALLSIGRTPIIHARLEDDRTRYHGLSVTAVPEADLADTLRRWPDAPLVLAGCFLPEIERLASLSTCAVFDSSMAEWAFTRKRLDAVLPPERLALGTLAPLHDALPAVWKWRGGRVVG